MKQHKILEAFIILKKEFIKILTKREKLYKNTIRYKLLKGF